PHHLRDGRCGPRCCRHRWSGAVADRPPKVAPPVTRIVAVVALVALAACTHTKSTSLRTGGVVTLAAGPASRYRAVTASGPGGTVELTGTLRDAAVPLLA